MENRGNVKKDFCISAVFEKEVKMKTGIFYQHLVQMQGGDKGQYLSKERNQTKFVVGVEVEYQCWQEERTKADGDTWKVSKIAPKQQSPFKAQGNHYDKPEVIISITKTEMMHQALYTAIHLEKTGTALTDEQIVQLRNKYYKYCFKDTGEERPDSNSVMKRRSSIKLAVENLQRKGVVATSDKILESANFYYEQIK